jgi:small conductance mechanosensitive channel
VLRNFEGQVHVIPNGTIQTVTVLTKDWNRAVVDVPIAYSEDLGRVFEALTRTNEALAADMAERILEKPQILVIERLSEEGVTIRMAVKTPPAKQGDVVHEWRRRVKESLQHEGIELPRRSITVVSGRETLQWGQL